MNKMSTAKTILRHKRKNTYLWVMQAQTTRSKTSTVVLYDMTGKPKNPSFTKDDVLFEWEVDKEITKELLDSGKVDGFV